MKNASTNLANQPWKKVFVQLSFAWSVDWPTRMDREIRRKQSAPPEQTAQEYTTKANSPV